MTDEAEKPKTTHYELSTGAIAMLKEVLPAPAWYKENPKAGLMVSRGVDACEKLPDVSEAPAMTKEETKTAFNKRFDAWADPVLQFEWTEKQKDAVKVCVSFYLKQGAFQVTKHTKAIIRLLGLDDE